MKPVLYKIPSFDQSDGTKIKFSWNGNMPKSNTLVIKNNATDVVVYNSTQTTIKLEHDISSTNSLVNGTLYSATIQVTDTNDNISESSEPFLFYCYTSPTFSINISDGQEISAQTYGVTLTYSQEEGEELESYRILVKNSLSEIVYDSGVQYLITEKVISNLQDNNTYIIECTGVTVGGTELTTGVINFTANFVEQEAYFECEVKNLYDKGEVYIRPNIISIEGTSENGEISYINGSVANLSNDVVNFDSDFTIDSNFVCEITGYGFTDGRCVAKLTGVYGDIQCFYIKDGDADYFMLLATRNGATYMITSDRITALSPTDVVSFLIRYEDGLYGLEVDVE